MSLAYWLARFYHQYPDVFLDCTPSEIAEHVAATSHMVKSMKDTGD